MFDDFTGQYVDDTPQVESSTFSDFFTAARNKIASVLPSQGETSAVSSQLMDAIYAFGAGKVDAARDKLAASFLATGEGKKLQSSAIQQTIMQYLPVILAAVIGLVALGFFARR